MTSGELREQAYLDTELPCSRSAILCAAADEIDRLTMRLRAFEQWKIAMEISDGLKDPHGWVLVHTLQEKVLALEQKLAQVP